MDLKSEKALALRGHYGQQEPCRQVTPPPRLLVFKRVNSFIKADKDLSLPFELFVT